MRRRKEGDLRAALSKLWARGTDWKQMDWKGTEFLREFDDYKLSGNQGKWVHCRSKALTAPGPLNIHEEQKAAEESIYLLREHSPLSPLQMSPRRAKDGQTSDKGNEQELWPDAIRLNPVSGLLCRASGMLQTMNCCVCPHLGMNIHS